MASTITQEATQISEERGDIDELEEGEVPDGDDENAISASNQSGSSAPRTESGANRLCSDCGSAAAQDNGLATKRSASPAADNQEVMYTQSF